MCCYDNTLDRFPTKPMLTTKLSFDLDLAAYIHNLHLHQWLHSQRHFVRNSSYFPQTERHDKHEASGRM